MSDIAHYRSLVATEHPFSGSLNTIIETPRVGNCGLQPQQRERVAPHWEGIHMQSAALAYAFYLRYTHTMRLTIQLKLLPTPEQADALKRTLVRANAACNHISQVVWE